MSYKNKIFFTVKKWNVKSKDIIGIPQLFNSKFIHASHEPFGANPFFNVDEYINRIED